MCGIFGYIGSKPDTIKLIFEGLKTLEYRGYDSWGIAVKIENNKLRVEKNVGKLPDKILNPQFLALNSTLGIGHTRWATHGGVTVGNAHPHLDCTGQIAVIHNGIVENFQELRTELLNKKHQFVSETDTEVIAHLLEENLKTGKSFTEAMRLTFNRLHGLNAVLALNSNSHEIVAAKNGSPLLVGIGEKGEYFLASDATGLIKHTKQVIFLEDHQMVTLGTELKMYALPEGKEIKPKINLLDWDFEDSQKGKYPHFIIKEIYEQPRVIENIALTYAAQTKQLAELIKNAFGTFMVGCGTASYAALAGTYLFSNIAKKHLNFALGSEFN
ncbi:MAG TPA: class II glutamine amidotransferase, partial [Patescibacteria group bacterium]